MTQNMSRDSVSVEENNTDMTSNTTADQDNDDNILSETDLPNLDILNLVNNTKVNSNVTETEKPAITEEVSTGGNVTETGGNVTETGGNVTETGGNVTETGGNVTETGGNVTETGGNFTETEEQPAVAQELCQQRRQCY